jgi:hypothetical protein
MIIPIKGCNKKTKINKKHPPFFEAWLLTPSSFLMAHIKFMRIKQQTCPKKEEKIRLQMIEGLV